MVAGKDVLTNMHANTTIPEVHGAARAWEVTGDQRWRDRRRLLAVSRYRPRLLRYRQPDLRRIWTPPGELSARSRTRTRNTASSTT